MRGDTKKFGTEVKSQMSGISGALKGAFAFVGVASFKNVIDEVAQLGRLARNIGADFEGFQTVTNAARQFGVEAETVADAIKDLDVKMTDGSLGAKAYAEVFDLVGISLDEAMGMSSLERFYAFADAVKAADGQLSMFSADEINDAMFRLIPLLEQGADGIKRMGDEYVKFSDAQRKMAETGAREWDNLTHNLTWLVSTLAGAVIPFMQKLAHTVGVVPGEIFSMLTFVGKAMEQLFSGDFKGFANTMDGYYDHMSGMFGRLKDEYAEIWSDTPDTTETPEGRDASGVSVATRDEEAKAKTDAQKELDKQLAEQEKRKQALMTDEEKLLDIQKKRLEVEKELDELGTRLHEEGATPDEALKLAKMTTEWEELQTAEQKKQLEIQEKIKSIKEAQKEQNDAQAKRDAKALEDELKRENDIRGEIAGEKSDREEIGMDDEQILERRKAQLKKMQEDLSKGAFEGPDDVAQAELDIESLKTEIAGLSQSISEDRDSDAAAIAEQREMIESERKRREEIGMSDEEILARRKSELKEATAAFANLGEDPNKDGAVDADDDIFRNEAELDLEKRKSEIAQLEQSIADQDTDPQTSIISSSLAAIGGGGGVAAFGNDPVLNENKKQSGLLAQLVKLQGGTAEGGTFENPEL